MKPMERPHDKELRLSASQELDQSILPTTGESATLGVDPAVPVKPSEGCNSTNSWTTTS